MEKIIVAYVPVLHEGYRRFFEKYAEEGVIDLYIFGEGLIAEFDQLRKEVRQLPPEEMAKAVRALGIFSSVRVANAALIQALRDAGIGFIMPDDDVSRELGRRYLLVPAEYDRSVFLRWDKTKALEEREVAADEIISVADFDQRVMTLGHFMAGQATNLWRRVGAAIVKDGEVVLAGYNRQIPSPYTPYYEGDARGLFKKGLHIELTTDEHAESWLIGRAARSRDIGLEGADLYVTTFPCPPCAKLVASAGFKRVFFAEGYAMLDGDRVLRNAEIQIVRVKMKNPAS